MSRLAGFLLVAVSSVAFADTTEPPADKPKTEEAQPAAKSSKFPLRVVKILPDSEQVLLFDKNKGRHVLVEVGDTVGEYTISSIDEDEVTLGGKDIPVEVVLAAPESKKRAAKAKAAAKDKATTPEDPYASEDKPAEKTAKAPADPYADEEESAEEKPIRAVHWGKATGEGEKSTTSPFGNLEVPKPSEDVAKRGSMSTTDEASTDAKTEVKAAAKTEAKVDAKKPAKASAKKPEKTVDDAQAMADAMTGSAPATTEAAASGPAKLNRKDVHVALADFGALAASIDGSFTAKGVELSKVASGSVFAKAGLQTGDVITAVDGKSLKSLDDAADLYARAGSMKSATVSLVRGGKPQTLRVQIQ